MLAPDVVRTADPGLVPAGTEVAPDTRAVAEQTARFAARVSVSTVALVDGAPAVLVAPNGRLFAAMLFTSDGGRLTAIHIADAKRLARRSICVG